MRLRLPELLEQRGVTGYQVAKASGGRLSLSAVYSLLRRRGHFEKIKADHLEAFCEVLGVPPGDLLQAGERQTGNRSHRTRPAGRPNRQGG